MALRPGPTPSGISPMTRKPNSSYRGRAGLSAKTKLNWMASKPSEGARSMESPTSNRAMPRRRAWRADEVSGVGDVRGEAGPVGLEVVGAEQTVRPPSPDHRGGGTQPHVVELRAGERWTLRIAVAPGHRVAEADKQVVELRGPQRPDVDTTGRGLVGDHPPGAEHLGRVHSARSAKALIRSGWTRTSSSPGTPLRTPNASAFSWPM